MNFEQDSVIFKQKLYEDFKDSGIINRFQTTLRANLLQRIQKPGIQQSQVQTLQKQEQKKPFHLRLKFLYNILHEFMERNKLEYTISIFMPESNLSEKDCLNFGMMADILNLPEKLKLNSSSSVLQCIIDEWVKKNSSGKNQRSIQTQIEGETVGKKLQKIQKDYLAKIDYWKLIPNKQILENPTFQEHQKKLKAKFQIQKQRLRLDIERQIKSEMQRKFQNQYEFRLNQITKQHQKRVSQLKLRQTEILRSLQRKKSELQKKSLQLSSKQLQLIKKYQTREQQIQQYYKKRQDQVQKRQKQYWKKQLQVKAKKRQYEDTIRLVKQKVIQQAGQMPRPNIGYH